MDVTGQSATRDLARREILKRLLEVERARERVLSDELCARFALAPYWPLELAGVGLGISGDAQKVLDNAVQQNVLEAGPGPFPWNQPVYWMRGTEKESAITRLSRRTKTGFLQQEVHRAGLNLIFGKTDKIRADLRLWRWCTLAAAVDYPENFESALVNLVDSALRESTKAGHLVSPEALRWIEAAQPFAEALHSGYEAALATVSRRVELLDRQGHDVRELHDRAILDLLGDNEHWALHFIGAGGSGKTMLLRHLSIHLAKSFNIAVSRIDFDYLNPDYPERQPDNRD